LRRTSGYENNEAGQVEVKWTSTEQVKSTTTHVFNYF